MNDLFSPQDILSADEAFEQFWADYPRKVGKGAARKAYAKARKVASRQEILGGLHAQLPGLMAREKTYRPHPSTWLTQERWNDEPEEPSQQTSTQNARGSDAFDEARERALRSAARGPKRRDDWF